MADKVQDVMEGMIPVLKDLQEREIFSETEIKSIISKRREFEYRVSRRDSLKQDYLDYIKYEIALVCLCVYVVNFRKHFVVTVILH